MDGEEGLRSLLELPLTRLEAYEDVATELGSVMCEAAGAGTAEQLTELLLGLDEMRERVGAALAPLGRLAPLWGVQARFKPGEVAFLVKRFLVRVCVRRCMGSTPGSFSQALSIIITHHPPTGLKTHESVQSRVKFLP